MTPELSPDAYFERVEALAVRGDYAEASRLLNASGLRSRRT